MSEIDDEKLQLIINSKNNIMWRLTSGEIKAYVEYYPRQKLEEVIEDLRTKIANQNMTRGQVFDYLDQLKAKLNDHE